MSTLKSLELLRRDKPTIVVNDNVGEVRFSVGATMMTCLDFHEAKKLCWWLDYWIEAERADCSSCQHERSGCQYHDGD